MRGYNGWNPAERQRLGDRQYELLRLHPERRVHVCQACGATVGIVQHLEDYESPLDGIIGLCGRCHVAVHERFRYPRMWDDYRQFLREGFHFPLALGWKHGLASMCWSTRAFGDTLPGKPRGEGILDEIATGKWLNLGPHHNPDTDPRPEPAQPTLFDAR